MKTDQVKEYRLVKDDQLGGTLHIEGAVHYQGSRDELNEKLRARDDEIDRLRERIEVLEAQKSSMNWSRLGR